MEQIGLQITLRTNYLWTTSKTQFFPLAAIKDVIINETFYRVRTQGNVLTRVSFH